MTDDWRRGPGHVQDELPLTRDQSLATIRAAIAEARKQWHPSEVSDAQA